MKNNVGAAISRPKTHGIKCLVERIPPDKSQESLLLLEKVPAAAGECGGDPFRKCRSWYEGESSNSENIPRRF